jgi:hypothetical protein
VESEAALSPKPQQYGIAYMYVGRTPGKETVFSNQFSGHSGTVVIVLAW